MMNLNFCFDVSTAVAMATIFLVLVHGRHWTQAASGAAGRANVGLCPASSLESASLRRLPTSWKLSYMM